MSSCRCDQEPRGGRRRVARPRDDRGFTLLEVLVAAVVLVVALLSMFGLLDSSLQATAATRAREGATNLARQILEDARTIPYAQLYPSSIVGELQAMNGLANASPGPAWRIVRRGVTYTVKVGECAVDDPKNGYGKHENPFHENPFCPDSSTEGTADPSPENLKRITADVTWTAIGRSPDVHQAETVSAAGEAPGLTAGELKLIGPRVAAPAAPVVVAQPAENRLTFAVQSPAGTSAINWTVDGHRQTTAATFVSGTEWQFSWPIPLPAVSDGTYTVAAQAIDATGVYGPPISIEVTLIRTTPAAPRITYGGFNKVLIAGAATQVVELQWQANSERNVIGYRVRNGKHEVVCPAKEELSTATSCIDFNPPKPTEPAQELTYSVAALYRHAEGELLSREALSEGPPAAFTVEQGPPPGPSAPSKLEAQKNADGSVTLKWAEGGGGPAVVFYRIYRGSQNYTSRYGTSSPASREFTDTDAVTTHSYWVTAVDANMTESSLIGPVTG